MPVRLPCFARSRGTAGGWRRDSPVLAGAARASPGAARPPKPRREVCFGRSFPGRLLLYIPGSTSPSLPARRGLGVEKPRQKHLPPTSTDETPPNKRRGERLGWRSGDGGGGEWGREGGIKAALCCPRPAVIPGCKRAAGAAVRVCGCVRPLPAGARREPPTPRAALRLPALPLGCAHTRASHPRIAPAHAPRSRAQAGGARTHPALPPGQGEHTPPPPTPH